MTEFIPSECLDWVAQRGMRWLVFKRGDLLPVVRVDKTLNRVELRKVIVAYESGDLKFRTHTSSG
jgi:hypothetical protein